MVKPIIHDDLFLSRKSKPATKNDKQIIIDMIDTLKSLDNCLGIAANMIGESKNIIAIKILDDVMIMVNPKIVSHSDTTYKAEEGCLSHVGTKETYRFDKIEVEFQDANFKKHKETYRELTAQVIQHEMDHLKGILI